MNEDQSRVSLFNPIKIISEILKQNGFEDNLVLGHIKYDEGVNDDYDYQIIRSSSHDGTHLFTMMLIDEALLPLINKETYGTNTITVEELKQVSDIEYIIGDVKLEKKYGRVKLKMGERDGQTDTVYIPVRCKYTFR